MNRERIVLAILCQVWPILKPALEQAAKDTSSPVDDWIIQILDRAIKGICNV